MKAVVIKEFGGPQVLKLEDVKIPEPAANDVQIAVKAAGINRPDIFQRKGNYPPPPHAPQDIPGLEVSGIITEVGRRVDRWKAGDEVCALTAGGGYAEYAVAHSQSCLPKPSVLDFAQAAALPETVFTVWSNVFERGALRADETLLVHGGSSGIGTTAIQMAVALGAKVYATAGNDEKRAFCESLGAKCINYQQQDFADVIGQNSVDVILDIVGGAYFDKNIAVLKPEGRLVFINAVNGSVAELRIPELMHKRLTLTGSTLRNRDNNYKGKLAASVEENVWPLIEGGKFRPVIHKTFSLTEAVAAHELMEAGSHIGKIVLIVEGSK